MKKVLVLMFTFLLFYNLKGQILVGYYPLDGNANDASVNGNNGTVINAAIPTTDRNNIANGAYQFATSSAQSIQYIDLGTSSILKPASGISFGGWFFRSTWTISGSEGLFGCTQGAGYEFSLSSSGVSAWVHRGGSYATVYIPPTSITNGWHFFMCTYDSRVTRIYMDGQLQPAIDNANTNYVIDYINNSVLIGTEAGDTGPSGSEYFTGKADEIRIYNGALSAAAISALYMATLPVHLQGFSVTGNNGKAVVKWSSENELGFAQYEIEKSIDGIHFSTVSKVAASTVNGRNTYSLDDAVTKGTTYYYRLKMVDKDGTFTYSEVVKYTLLTASVKIALYPNPVTDYFKLEAPDNISQVDIINLNGSLVKRFKPAADNRYAVSELKTGTYTVRLTLHDKTTVSTGFSK